MKCKVWFEIKLWNEIGIVSVQIENSNENLICSFYIAT